LPAKLGLLQIKIDYRFEKGLPALRLKINFVAWYNIESKIGERKFC
jgi:hypothetical protein